MMASFLHSYGYSPPVITELLSSKKNQELPGLKLSPRQLLQTLGTEWGRGCVHPQVWLTAWEKTADRYLSLGQNVVCDDMRFFNEADLIQRKGGELWRVDRTMSVTNHFHASEGGLDDSIQDDEWDCILKNNDTEEDFKNLLLSFFQPIPV